MRKFLTCALCFVPTLAGAITLYYDTTGECDGWWLGTVQTGCPASNLRVTKFHPTTAASKVFGGIVIGDEAVVESDGTLKSFNSLSESTKSAIRAATSLDVYKQEWNVDDTVTVNFDARGGKMSGATTRQMGRGATLPTITGLRGDGASFSGWVDNSGNKVTSVSTNAAGTQNLTATYTCGTGTSKNANDVCVPTRGGGSGDDEHWYTWDDENEEVIVDNDSPSGVECGNQVNTGNPDFCSHTVIVHFHDRPKDNTTLSVTNGNEGTTLWCNRVWCYTPQQAYPNGGNAGSWVERINWPMANGYSFRGYYYRSEKESQTDLITDKGETNGRAVGHFFPKSEYDPTGTNPKFSIYNGWVAWYGDQSITGLPTNSQGIHEIDVYGAWAKKCDTNNDQNANCFLHKGSRLGTDSNGLQPGDVWYETSCRNGYHVTSATNNTYKPSCTGDTGVSISYNFVNQYGDAVNCNSVSNGTCTTDATYQMLTQSNYTCGGDLRYLKVNGKWYRPGYSVPCVSNVFGSDNATVTGYVCDPTCDNDPNPDNGRCIDVDSNQSINYNFNWYINNGYTTGGQLWGEESTGNPPYSKCKQLVCNDGYGLWKDNSGQYYCATEKDICIAQNPSNPSICDKYDFNFTCTSLTPPDGLTVSKGAITGNGLDTANYSCTYTVGCANSNAALTMNGTSLASPTITCTGEACANTQSLQNQLNNYSCFTCPGYNGSAPSVSVATPTQNGMTCSYNVQCRGGYAGPLSYTAPTYSSSLGYTSNTVLNNDGTYTVNCTGQSQCRDGYGPYQSLYYLTTEFSAFSCDGTGPNTDTCPSLTPNDGVVITQNQVASGCSYTISCSNQSDSLLSTTSFNGMPINPTKVQGGTETIRCSQGACDALTLSSQAGDYYCGTLPSYTCPNAPTGIGGVTVTKNGQHLNGSCLYTASCNNSNATCSGTVTSGGNTYNLCHTQVCTNQSTCNNLFGLYSANGNISCNIPEQTFTCPATTTKFTKLTVAVEPDTANERCTYTLNCPSGYTLAVESPHTCSSDCNTYVSSLNDDLCVEQNTPPTQIECPRTGFNLTGHRSATFATSTENTCTYRVTCADDYTVSPTTNYTCTGSNNCTVAQISTAINSGYTCNPPEPEFACLSQANMNGLLPDHMSISEPTLLSGNKCRYTLSCQGSDYSLNPSSPNTVTCTDPQCTETGVLALIDGGAYTCEYTPAFSCPAVGPDLRTPTNGTLTQTGENLSEQTCNYTVGCKSSYAFPTGNNEPETISCSGTTGSNGCTESALQSRIDAIASLCKAKISNCPAATITNGNVNSSLVNNDTACEYSVTCDGPAYVLGSGVQSTQTCEGTSACTTLAGSYGNSTCVFQCPTGDYMVNRVIGAASVTLTPSSNNTCNYVLNYCDDCYKIACADSGKGMVDPDNPGGGDGGDDGCSTYLDSASCQGTDCNNVGGSSSSPFWYNEMRCEYVGGSGCTPR